MGRGVRVLCVDDDEAVLSLLTEMLERVDDDIDVDGTTLPDEVPDRLHAGEHECVVCDYDMPRMNGLAVFETVRERHPDLPFILYTGKGSEEIASEAISAGVTDYLQKGSGRAHYELLANRIREYVDRYRTVRERELAEQRYRRLVEQSVVGIGLSQDGVFEYVNPKFAEIFGHSPDEMIGEPVFPFIDESDRDRVERALELRESGAVDSVHYVIAARDSRGDRFDLEVNGGRIVYDGDPAVLGVVRRLDARPEAPAAREAVAELDDRLSSALGAFDAVDAEGDSLREAREAVEAALAVVEGELPVDDEEPSSLDLGERCLATWERAAPGGASLSVEASPEVVGNRELVDRLFDGLWRLLDDADRPLSVTLAAEADGFRVRIEPSDGSPSPTVGSPTAPPALTRTAARLGWDVFMSETPSGGVIYSLKGVDRPP